MGAFIREWAYIGLVALRFVTRLTQAQSNLL